VTLHAAWFWLTSRLEAASSAGCVASTGSAAAAGNATGAGNTEVSSAHAHGAGDAVGASSGTIGASFGATGASSGAIGASFGAIGASSGAIGASSGHASDSGTASTTTGAPSTWSVASTSGIVVSSIAAGASMTEGRSPPATTPGEAATAATGDNTERVSATVDGAGCAPARTAARAAGVAGQAKAT